MKLVFRLVFWLVLVGAGWAAGDRYGAPGWLKAGGDAVIGLVQGYIGETEKNLADDEAASDGGFEHGDVEEDSAAAVENGGGMSGGGGSPAPSAASEGDVSENANLRINDAGLQIIKDSEGLRLEAYSGPGGRYIGYGHQMQPGEKSTITEAEADALLRQDVRAAEDGVRRRLTRPANENQFSAMVSLAYNLGVGGFGRSPVLEKFNAGDIQGAADAFLNHNRGGGVVLDHLTHRRELERELFLTPA